MGHALPEGNDLGADSANLLPKATDLSAHLAPQSAETREEHSPASATPTVMMAMISPLMLPMPPFE